MVDAPRLEHSAFRRWGDGARTHCRAIREIVHNLEPDRTTILAEAAGEPAALIFRPIFATRPGPCVLARAGTLWQEPAARGCRFRPIP